MRVISVTREQCKPFIIGIHYAHRWPSVTYRFGLLVSEELVGVVTYGTPPSPNLRTGVAGKGYSQCVVELNRLVLRDNGKNQASFLVGASLRMLPKGLIVVSFADTQQGHIGYVYQATNFTYHGLSAKRTDWKLRGKENLHGMTVADEFRGQPNRAALMRAKYGTDFYLKERPRKHRYIYIIGSKSFKRQAGHALQYPQLPYPKGGKR
jgi:hypothetical protein